jgi:hypothetical protein
MRILLVSLLASAVLLTSFSASANEWFSKAKDFMNSRTGETVQKAIGEQVSQNGGALGASLSQSEIIEGLREALRVSVGNVVDNIGQTNGFLKDQNIRIPLPGPLERVNSALSTVGMGGLTEDLQVKMNRAAEYATPKAKTLFIDAISQMSVTDARAILTGPEDAATSYLRRTMGPALKKEIAPYVSKSMSQAGVVQAYDAVMSQYQAIPFMPNAKANMNDYVSEKTLDGIFYYVAKEEAGIRANPAARTSDLLKKVFAQTL